MVGITGTLGITLLILLGGLVFLYLAIIQLTESMNDIEIIENEEEFVDLFKNGLRNSCWNDYQDREDKASL